MTNEMIDRGIREIELIESTMDKRDFPLLNCHDMYQIIEAMKEPEDESHDLTIHDEDSYEPEEKEESLTEQVAEFQDKYKTYDDYKSDPLRKVDLDPYKELIDGAYDIVEIWDATTPAQKQWKKRWMDKARKYGAEPSF